MTSLPKEELEIRKWNNEGYFENPTDLKVNKRKAKIKKNDVPKNKETTTASLENGHRDSINPTNPAIIPNLLDEDRRIDLLSILNGTNPPTSTPSKEGIYYKTFL